MAKMQAARTAAKLTFARRRAEKRQAEKLAKVADREAPQGCGEGRTGSGRAAAKAANRKTVGRPPKPPKREGRWTAWRPEFARRVYRAIRHDAIKHPDTDDIAEFLGVTPRTIRNWKKRHVTLARAIVRGVEDRARLRGAVWSCRRVEYDWSKINRQAKTDRGRFKDVIATAKVWIDHEREEQLERGGNLTMHMRRRMYACPPPPAHVLAKTPARKREQCLRYMAESPYVEMALGVIEGGALSNRAIAKGLFIGESTLRLWRTQDAEPDAAIREAVDAYRERQRNAPPRALA